MLKLQGSYRTAGPPGIKLPGHTTEETDYQPIGIDEALNLILGHTEDIEGLLNALNQTVNGKRGLISIYKAAVLQTPTGTTITWYSKTGTGRAFRIFIEDQNDLEPLLALIASKVA